MKFGFQTKEADYSSTLHGCVAVCDNVLSTSTEPWIYHILILDFFVEVKDVLILSLSRVYSKEKYSVLRTPYYIMLYFRTRVWGRSPTGNQLFSWCDNRPCLLYTSPSPRD